ncbi:CopG family transcriptional regulator [Sphingobium sp.]|uniref:CopG family transcriptional regulator n=1 Tax=Sphingobium sp. TaxID=1912891 RepID=UPI000DAFBB86|nr:CopG family transcriptional regulator [Sphingobium sp.]PZU68713.1 MAG: CopG family transcriptional regulator [Sphingobium sp.]
MTSPDRNVRKKKAQISVYLDPATMAMLSDYAARRDQPQSMIAEAAIASFLSPDAAERREAVIAKRLDQIDRRITRLERDVGIAIESLAVFIKFWVATTPALPEPAAHAARAKAGERYDQFVTALGRRLAKGPKLRQEVSEDISGGDAIGSDAAPP